MKNHVYKRILSVTIAMTMAVAPLGPHFVVRAEEAGPLPIEEIIDESSGDSIDRPEDKPIEQPVDEPVVTPEAGDKPADTPTDQPAGEEGAELLPEDEQELAIEEEVLTEIPTSLAAPTNFTILNYGGMEELYWSPVEGATGYEIYFAIDRACNTSAISAESYKLVTTLDGEYNYDTHDSIKKSWSVTDDGRLKFVCDNCYLPIDPDNSYYKNGYNYIPLDVAYAVYKIRAIYRDTEEANNVDGTFTDPISMDGVYAGSIEAINTERKDKFNCPGDTPYKRFFLGNADGVAYGFDNPIELHVGESLDGLTLWAECTSGQKVKYTDIVAKIKAAEIAKWGDAYWYKENGSGTDNGYNFTWGLYGGAHSIENYAISEYQSTQYVEQFIRDAGNTVPNYLGIKAKKVTNKTRALMVAVNASTSGIGIGEGLPQCYFWVPINISEAEEGADYADLDTGTIYSNMDDAWAAIRSNIHNRKEDFTVLIEQTAVASFLTDNNLYRPSPYGMGMEPMDLCEDEIFNDYVFGQYAERACMESWACDSIADAMKSTSRYGSTISFNNQNYYAINWSASYITSAEQEAELDATIASWLAPGGKLNSVVGASDYDRAKAAFDIVKEVQWVNGLSSVNGRDSWLNFTPYSAVKYNQGSCQASAMLFARLCRELGVPARVIKDDYFNKAGEHAYNIAKIGDKWYYVDCNKKLFLKGSKSFSAPACLPFYKTVAFTSTHPISQTDCSVQVKVALDPGTGGSVSNSLITVGIGQPYGELPVPTNTDTNLVFNGWYTAAQGADNATLITADTVVGKLDTTISVAQTLYAWWIPKPTVLAPYTSDRADSNAEGTACTITKEPGYAVNLYCDTPGAQIYYTTAVNGTPATPDKSATLFTNAIELPVTTYVSESNVQTFTIKAIAYVNTVASAVMTYSYSIPDSTISAATWGDVDPALFSNNLAGLEKYKNRYWLTYVGAIWNTAPSMKYTGQAITLSGYELYYGNKKLTEGTDYTVRYANNKAVADTSSAKAPTVTFAGKGNYSGTISKKFSITAPDTAAVKVDAKKIIVNGTEKDAIAPLVYTGSAQTPAISGIYYKKDKNTDAVLISPSKYTLSYKNNINASGKAVMTITFDGTSYVGSVTKNFTIKPCPIDTITTLKVNGVAFSDASDVEKSVRYNNLGPVDYVAGLTNPVTTVSDGTNSLTVKKDYNVSGVKNNEKHFVEGGKSVTVTGRGNYSGKVAVCFTVTSISLQTRQTAGQIKATYTTPVATGKAGDYKLKNLKLYDTTLGTDSLLKAGKDYESSIKYYNGTGVELDGKSVMTSGNIVKCRIVGKGSYTGTIDIVYVMLSNYEFDNAVTVTIKDVNYSNKANICKPAITVVDKSNNKKLSLNKDYVIDRYEYINATMVSYKDGKTLKYKQCNPDTSVAATDIIPAGTPLRAVIKAKQGGLYYDSADAHNTITRNFVIAADIAKTSVKIPNQTVTDKAITLTKDKIEIKLGKQLLSAKDYDIVSYEKNIKTGTAVVYLRGKGAYMGTKKATFKIVPKTMNYTINYLANGGTAKNQMKASVTTGGAKMSKNGYTAPSGFEFGGWSFEQYALPTSSATIKTPEFAVAKVTDTPVFDMTAVSITPTSGVNATSVINMQTVPAGSEITVYAYWRPKTYKITYNLGGGKLAGKAGVDYPNTHNIFQEVIYPVPTRNGYTFDGWYFDNKFTYYAGNKLYEDSYNNQNFTLYAKWVKIQL